MKYNDVRIQRYDYKKADYSKIREELNNIDWKDFMKTDSGTSNCWIKFKQLLLTIENKHVPKKRNATKKNKKAFWLTYKEKNLVLKKRKVFAKYKDKDHPAVRQINKKVSKEVKRANMN